MKALTLWQPWASLVIIGAKRYETRSWCSGYRGWLAIHAASSSPKWAFNLCKRDPFASALSQAGIYGLPAGCILGICKVVAETRMTQTLIDTMDATEIAFGDWQVGRWAWKLENPIRAHIPISARGRQRLWEWKASTEADAWLQSLGVL